MAAQRLLTLLLVPASDVLGLVLTAPNRSLSALHSLAIHPWPCKNGNFMRTGQGALSGSGPRDIAHASWLFENENPGNQDAFYQSPVLDSQHNALFSSTTGRLYSMAPTGKLNWAVQLRRLVQDAGQPPTPVLLGDAVYAVDGQGFLVKLSLATGAEFWRKRHAHRSGHDSWSVGLDLDSGTIFTVGFPTKEDGRKCSWGGTNLYALDAVNGHTKWNYRMGHCNCNIMPSAYKGSVIFSDSTGTVYALNITTGLVIWKKRGNGPQSFTTGTAAVGDNGLVYATSNVHPGPAGTGMLRVYDASTGDVQWERPFDRETNNAPAVYKDRGGRTLVVVGVSHNAGPPRGAIQDAKFAYRGTIYALDANSGREVWTWEPPVWKHASCAGSTWQRICMPDAFSNPSVDSNSTIYIGWMGGDIFAIDGTSGLQLSSFHIGSGIQGAPGIANGVLVASSCQRMAGFSTQLA